MMVDIVIITICIFGNGIDPANDLVGFNDLATMIQGNDEVDRSNTVRKDLPNKKMSLENQRQKFRNKHVASLIEY